jgi:diguanylate cyclase (GGDEF)-like protein
MKTILLIDDDREFAALVVPALEHRGHRVIHVARAAEAGVLLQAESPDLLVVDGLLPDADGVSFIAKLREGGSQVPVVFVSAFWRDLASFNRLTKELGVNLVVHKPVVPALFAEEVEGQLERRRAPLPRPGAAVEEAFRNLKTEYARTLPQKLRDLCGFVREVRADPRDPSAAADALMRAHRLRGTAGSYGFREVGEAAGLVEEALARACLSGAGESDWAEVERALALTFSRAEVAATSSGRAGQVPRVFAGRLLIVSADPAFSAFAEHVASHHLYEVSLCDSPAQALERSPLTRPEAAIIDLPVESAARLARDLRGLPDCSAMPLAFVAAQGAAADRVAAAHAGASLFLIKPMEPATLDLAARQLIAAQRATLPRALVVDDDEEFAERVCLLLRSVGLFAEHIAEPERVIDVMEERPPDLLLLDVLMPGLSGFEVCRMLRASPRWQDLPILFLTGASRVEARLGAFQAGGDDYLTKPVLDEELLARVKVRIDRARLLREKYDKDPLTGLLLRRPFMEALRARLLEAVRHGRPFAVGLIDLDHFKAINDTHGHLAGDGVLSSLGQLLARRFRAEDLRCRWGGEEFLLAFPGETAQTVEGALQRLLEEFGQMEFAGDGGESFRSSFSVGVAGFPEDGDSLESLLRAADRRLYAAKDAGRNRVVWEG